MLLLCWKIIRLSNFNKTCHISETSFSLLPVVALSFFPFSRPMLLLSPVPTSYRSLWFCLSERWIGLLEAVVWVLEEWEWPTETSWHCSSFTLHNPSNFVANLPWERNSGVAVATVFADTAGSCVIIGAPRKKAVIVVFSVLHDWDDLTTRYSPLVQELLLCTDNKHWKGVRPGNVRGTEVTTVLVLLAWHQRPLFFYSWCHTDAEVVMLPKKQVMCVYETSWTFFSSKGHRH